MLKKGEWVGNKHPRWKGGIKKFTNGYIGIYCPNHPRVKGKYPYIYEHVLILERKLGRYLRKGEVSHHINGIKTDNRPRNLEVFKSQGIHAKGHLMGIERRDLRKYKRVKKLPRPKCIGQIVTILPQRTYIAIKCKCNKLIWIRKGYNSERVYCKHKK